MSEQQALYLRKIKLYKTFIKLSRLLLLILFVSLWEIAAYTGIIDDFIFSSPSRMLSALFTLILSGEIFIHTFITIAETLISFGLVIGIGLLTAVLMWSNRTISDILEPYIVTLNSLPKSALAPVLIVWLGTGYTTILVTAISVSVFGTILSLYNSFNETDKEQLKMITTLGGSKKHQLFKLILPGSIPAIISCMKVNIGLCLVGVIIAEFLVANAGLGYVIIYNSQIFKMDLVLLSICLLCIVAAILYKAVNLFEKYYTSKQ